MPWVLIISLIVLILISAFFSGSETSMMSLNRFRLKYLVREKNKRAIKAQKLLQRPDRLLGMVLVGNTFANILAGTIATILAGKYFGELGIFIATILLTIAVLIFSEIMPKTVAALKPEKFAFSAVFILKPLLKVFYPLILLLNAISNSLLFLFGIKIGNSKQDVLSAEELRNVVTESTGDLNKEKKHMLLGVLDLSNITVEHVMIPRHKIIGLDLNKTLSEQLKQLRLSNFSRLPVYQDSLDKIVGVLDIRKAIGLLNQKNITKVSLKKIIGPAYFIPETTSLEKQLVNFQNQAERMALIVDEYGDIQGLVTLEDILEEIVGEFSCLEQPCANDKTSKKENGEYIVAGDMTVRDLNRDLGLELDINGPKTLSGLIMETLQSLPIAGTCLLISGYSVEIIQVKGNAVSKAKIHPEPREKTE